MNSSRILFRFFNKSWSYEVQIDEVKYSCGGFPDVITAAIAANHHLTPFQWKSEEEIKTALDSQLDSLDKIYMDSETTWTSDEYNDMVNDLYAWSARQYVIFKRKNQ